MYSREHTVLAAALTLTVAAMFIVHLGPRRETATALRPKTPTAAAPAPVGGLAAFQPETRRRVAAVLTTLAPKAEGEPALTATEDKAIATARALAPTFAALFAQQNYYDRDRIYADVFAELAEDPGNVAAASRLLSDPDFLVHAIDPEQRAVARVYALHFLRHQANADNAAPLVTTTRALFARVSADGEVVPGQYRDVEDLMVAVLRHKYETAELWERPGDIVREVLRGPMDGHGEVADEALLDAVRAAFWTLTLGSTKGREAWVCIGNAINDALRE